MIGRDGGLQVRITSTVTDSETRREGEKSPPPADARRRGLGEARYLTSQVSCSWGRREGGVGNG